MDFQRLFYINHEFENRTFDWVRLIFFLFGEFDFVRLPNSIELNPPIEFDWNLVRLGSIYYAGQFVEQLNRNEFFFSKVNNLDLLSLWNTQSVIQKMKRSRWQICLHSYNSLRFQYHFVIHFNNSRNSKTTAELITGGPSSLHERGRDSCLWAVLCYKRLFTKACMGSIGFS